MRQNTGMIYIIDDPSGYGQKDSLEKKLEQDNHIILGISNDIEKISQTLREHYPDLILCNTEPGNGLSGIEMAKRISQHNKSPVVFIGKKPTREVISVNAYGFLLEPVCYEELEIAIQLAFYRSSLETELQSYRSHLNQAQRMSDMGSWEWNFVEDTLTWSDNIYRIFGLEPQAFTPTYAAFLEHVHPYDRELVSNSVDKALEKLAPYDIEHRILKKNGGIGYVREVGEVVLLKGKPSKMIGSVIDITSRHRSMEKMHHLAYHDALTDLANRTLLMDRLMILVARAKRDKLKFAVLFIDLDGFKEINDLFGHKVGDKVLQSVAGKLKLSTRTSDTVARIGGDEFVALIDEITSRTEVEFVAEKILKGISTEYNTGVASVRLTASIGIAIYPEEGTSTDELLTNADNAMYCAKFSGKNKICFFADAGPHSPKS